MKILAVSDTHGCFERFYKACKWEKPDVVLFSGDCSSDALEMELIFPEIKFYIVRGNCDYDDYTTKDEITVELEGVRFFLTHGHIYSVKRDYSRIEEKGYEEKADIIVFGHTHNPDCVDTFSRRRGDRQDKVITLFNPGAVLNGKYGVIEIEQGKKIKFTHKNLD